MSSVSHLDFRYLSNCINLNAVHCFVVKYKLVKQLLLYMFAEPFPELFLNWNFPYPDAYVSLSIPSTNNFTDVKFEGTGH